MNKNSNKTSWKWNIIISLFLCTVLWGGLRSAYGVFFKEMLSTFEWPAAQLASLQSLNLLIYGFCSPWIGWLATRFWPFDRLSILCGWILTAVGLASSAFACSYPALFVCYGLLFGFGTTLASPVSFNIALNRRVTLHRGLAIGLVSAGAGIGTFLLTPQIQIAILHYGWRKALVYLSFFPLSLIFLVVLLLGEYRNEQLVFHTNPETESLTFLTPYRNFALIAFTPLQFLVIQFFIVHGIKMMDVATISAPRAATIFSLSGILNAVGRIAFGYLLDRTPLGIIGLINYSAILISGISALLLSVFRHVVFAYVTFTTMGLAWAISIPQAVVVLNKIVGLQKFASYYGLVEAFIGFGGALGAMVGGISLDVFNGYEFAIFICIVCIGLSIGCYASVLNILQDRQS